MKHKTATAIIENGILKRIDTKLPKGKIKVQIIYNVEEKVSNNIRIVKETSGIYNKINAKTESRKLRDSWSRNGKK